VDEEHNLLKSIGDIKVCKDFEMFKVKVPIIFPARGVFRYTWMDVTGILS
jgi:hypothetical protein